MIRSIMARKVAQTPRYKEPEVEIRKQTVNLNINLKTSQQ